MYEPPRVFIDTNILKFSAVKKHVYAKRRKLITWGHVQKEIEYHIPYTINDLHKIKSDVQRRDAVILGMLAFAGTSGRVKFFSHREVDDESAGLPNMVSASGRFFDCPIEWVGDPHPTTSRADYSGRKSANEHALEFLQSIKDIRYVELTKMVGAFQGKEKPLQLNQARDAYHIWCAEGVKISHFLTMDYKLQRVIDLSKSKPKLRVLTPHQLFQEVLIQVGTFHAFPFLWRAFRFAKRQVAFQEGEGWN